MPRKNETETTAVENVEAASITEFSEFQFKPSALFTRKAGSDPTVKPSPRYVAGLTRSWETRTEKYGQIHTEGWVDVFATKAEANRAEAQIRASAESLNLGSRVVLVDELATDESGFPVVGDDGKPVTTGRIEVHWRARKPIVRKRKATPAV